MRSDAMTFVAITAALVAGLSGPVQAECREKELPAGTVLADGTVAGERQALDYFKDKEPELHLRIAAMEPAQMRRAFGKHFEWFQRVGNCRKLQKREAIRALKKKLSIPEKSP